jgi:hypothetical protein
MRRYIFLVISIVFFTTCQQVNDKTPEYENVTVYISNGVYHQVGCYLLGTTYTSTTIGQAERNGATECSTCKPKYITQGSSESSVAVQCRGYTKKGNRCKNRTKSSNGYCYLHGGN